MATLRDIFIIRPQFMGALLSNDFATFLHRKEVTVDSFMWCPHLEARKLYPTGS